MGIHIARFKAGGEVRWGWVRAGQVVPIPGKYVSLAEFLESGQERAWAMSTGGGGKGQPLSEVEVLSPVTSPCNVVCQGQNYRSHMLEVGQDPDTKDFNQFFRKASSSLTSSRGDIVRPQRVRMLDYEIELGLVIGRGLHQPMQVTRERLHEVVAGLVMANDVSARDLQLLEGQWHKAKSFRTFCPVGPFLYLLSPEDRGRLMDLRLSLSVNGELRQSASTAEMIYPPEETLSELSEVMDLYPGDLVLTGTPSGVAAGRTVSRLARSVGSFMRLFLSDRTLAKLILKSSNPAAYLKEGDVIRASITSPDGVIHLGMQENRIVAQEAMAVVEDTAPAIRVGGI
ncbi:fumarylacetoacetate hydrolase [Myxococcus stipitatus DSM 14675]|uniref:Fumarylacetoacetate hydrolase n=1 Tax=Myxococcus stipitatus (strain DSM 14675 / JCM 12634 / Mx s8) TaxID=1278073 RepID=L7UEF5_MYXSD|nr:fumarylacetoacetate hydrolase family protein [Myxococcus stipitatus]AGC46255.1 fumarylacetoacetate hydrolase [Myxococcus stipitatus DSM 14675]